MSASTFLSLISSNFKISNHNYILWAGVKYSYIFMSTKHVEIILFLFRLFFVLSINIALQHVELFW